LWPVRLDPVNPAFASWRWEDLRKVPKPYDATTKFLVEGFPADWLAFAGLGPIERVDVIDANLSTITAEADKVFRVAGPEPWLAHVELQTSHEAHLPRRLLRYNTLLDDRHDLPTRSIVVLLRPQADGDDLSGVYRRSLPGGSNFLEFRYDIVRAWEQPVESILTGGLGTLPMALVSNLEEMDPDEVIRRMQERIDREPREVAGLFWSATAILMGLRFGREEITKLLRGVRDMKESVFYQMVLEEGEAKGEAKGELRGKATGKVEEARRILLQLGQHRLGPADPAMVATIEATKSIDRLEEWLFRLYEVSSWEELRVEPPLDE
jgi:predicted transposase YdaD